jgi:mono/diheme cytochrome c family protein
MRRKPITIVFLVAVFLLVITAWLWLKLAAGGFSARAKPSPIEQFAATTARKLAMPKHAKNRRNAVPYSDEALEQARTHWADHCAYCHANDGSGNTEVGRNLYPKPPDMRASATQSLTDGELYFAINRGIRLTGMPAWGEPGDDDEDSWKLVYFIRHLPKMTPQEAATMTKLNPESCMEREEERREEEFLNGDSDKTAPVQKNQQRTNFKEKQR